MNPLTIFNIWFMIFIVSINVITIYNLHKFTSKSLLKKICVALEIFVGTIIVERGASVFYFEITNELILENIFRVVAILFIIAVTILIWELYWYFHKE